MVSSIPRRIIQTGKSRDLPLIERAAATNLRLLNPEFEYRFFDDSDVEEFIRVEYPQYRAIFESFPFRIQKYDFFRYLAVYLYGGFYFDLDVFLAKGLDDLCEYGCVFSFEELSLHRFLRDEYGMDWEVANYAFGAAAGDPFVGAIIENCVRAQLEPAWAARMWAAVPKAFRRDFYVLDTTGPGLVSRTLAECYRPAMDVHVLFPKDVCDESEWHQFGSHGFHMQVGGWRSQQGFWRRRLRSMWEKRQRAEGIRKSRKRGPARWLEFGRAS